MELWSAWQGQAGIVPSHQVPFAARLKSHVHRQAYIVSCRLIKFRVGYMPCLMNNSACIFSDEFYHCFLCSAEVKIRFL